MKAYHIMMFLLLFNMSVSAIGALHIYNGGLTVSADYDLSDGHLEAKGGVRVPVFFGSLMVGILTGVITGTILNYFAGVPGDASFAYGLFAGSFWGITYSAANSLFEIGRSDTDVSGVVTIIVGMFLVITCGTFIAGLVQMIKGGWQSFE